MNGYIDTHCHLDFDAFAPAASVWAGCRAAHIRHLIIPSVSSAHWARSCALANSLDGVYFAAGIHPWWMNIDEPLFNEATFHVEIAPYLADARCCAIGETGLDATIAFPLDQQIKMLSWHLALAHETDKPIILHSRKTHNDVLRLLKPFVGRLRGVVHGFSGSFDEAMQFYRAGFLLGIGGVVTYPRAAKTRRAVTQLPLEAMVLETDAPDMPLAGFQGQLNSPLQIPAIAKVIAQLRGDTLENIAQSTTANAKKLFKIT